jgi:hypothetical protein
MLELVSALTSDPAAAGDPFTARPPSGRRATAKAIYRSLP